MPVLVDSSSPMALAAALVGALYYAMRMSRQVVDDLVVNMVDVGEETGDLDKMLMKVADNFDEDADVLVGALTSMIEPMMIVMLGLVVGTIVLAMFLPMVKMIQVLM